MKRPTPIALVLLSCAWPAFVGAAELDLSKLPAPAKQEGVTYVKNIQPLFKASCFRCHGPERPKGDLRLDSLEGVLKGSHDGKVIVPGASERSKLVHAVARLHEEIAMPPKPRAPKPGQKASAHPPAKPLTIEEVALVRAWIDQGAK